MKRSPFLKRLFSENTLGPKFFANICSLGNIKKTGAKIIYIIVWETEDASFVIIQNRESILLTCFIIIIFFVVETFFYEKCFVGFSFVFRNAYQNLKPIIKFLWVIGNLDFGRFRASYFRWW